MNVKFFLWSLIIFGFLAFNFSSAESPSSSDLQSLIRDLQAQIQALQAQVKTLEAELGVKQEPAVSQTPASIQSPSAVLPQESSVTSTASQEAIPQSQPESAPPELIKSLQRGSSGDDVRKLQEFLAKDKEIYPEGLITGFFGPKTEEAVKKWQQKQGIESIGIVGPKTIARFKDIGKGVIQGLIQQGAGQSGVIPPGLLKKQETQTPSGAIPAQPIGQTGTTTIPAIPLTQTATTTQTSTTTPSGTIPATPATPAQPATGQTAVPATPAQPAIQTVSDTTAPVISNIQATNITSNSFTITWTTNEVSDSQLEYGLTTSYGSSTALNTSMVTSHSMPVSGLIPSTAYQIKVKSKDAAGNLGIGTFSAVTLAPSVVPPSDTTAPIISNVQVINITANSATVTWTTNEASDSRVDYSSSQTISLDSQASIKIDSALVTSHSLSLANQLSPGTTYRYKVYSTDSSSNRAVSPEYSFTSSSTAVASTLRVTYPNGGEQWVNGNSYTVTWVNPLQAGFSGDGNYRWIVALKRGATEYVGNGSALVTQSSYIWNTWTFANSSLPAGSDYLAEVILQRNCSLTPSQPCPEASAVISGSTVDFSDNYFTVLSQAQPDTSAPSVPANLTASTASSSQINLSWSASIDNIAVVGYRIYRGGVQIATVTTGTSYSDTGLTAATTYSYTIAAYDAAGNISGQSIAVSATTTAALLPAPLAGDTGTSHLGATFSAGGTAPSYTGIYGLGLRFRYDANSISSVQSFRIYHKKPGASSFSVIATFPNPSSIINGSYIRSGTWGVPDSWTLTYINSSLGPFWEAQTSNPANLSSSSNFTIGEYNSYVVAVDASGTESQPSETMKHVVLERTSILSPIGSQTVSNPTFSWTVASGWPQSPSYYIRVYNTSSVIWSKNVSVSASASTGSNVYDGPALSPGQTYTVFIDAPGLYYSNIPYTSMNAAIQNFSISSGAMLDTDDNLASVLKSLSSVLQKLQEALKK